MKLGVHVVQSSPYTRCSSLKTVKWAYARILSIINARSFKGSKQAAITPELLSKVERFLIMEVQKTWSVDRVSSNFRTLLPVMQDGIWVVGVRIAHHSPLTPDNKPMVLLPNNHPLTRLIMIEAHRDCGHKGRDTTVARFRSRFWTAHATKMSKSICENCQMCKLLHVRDMDQLMGQMPSVRLVPSPPFTSVRLDLFGPYPVRGEVQKRTTGKAWGVIFTDLCSRAVHIEVVFGYDTQSFLLALSRFASIRGWPTVIYSDPGSQLVGANTELVNAWKDINLDTLKKHGAEFGLRWVFGPADSPWYQGAVESLVKSAKKAIELSVRKQRLSVIEMLTVFTQAADLLNERPLGVLPGFDSPLTVLTPNSLLLGRSTSRNPGGYSSTHTSLRSRLALVQGIVDQFWTHWTTLYAPTLIRQSKWLLERRPLQIDVVIVTDPGVMKAVHVTLAYRIGDKSEIGFLRERPSMFKMIKLTIFVFLHKRKLQHLIYSYPIAIYTNVASNVTFCDIIIDHC